MITAFAHAHPGVAITVREDVASSLLDGLRQGDLDLVMALTDPSILDGLDGIRLLDDELVLIAPVHHPLTRAKVVRIERLANQPVITTGAGSALRDALIALVPDGHIVAEATDLETVLEFTARGLGVTLMPRSVAAPHSDRLAIRPLHPAQTLPFALIWRANQSFTPAAHAFRDHVLSTLRT
jgi:DNA-binding transcriptional LysR family regulator